MKQGNRSKRPPPETLDAAWLRAEIAAKRCGMLFKTVDVFAEAPDYVAKYRAMALYGLDYAITTKGNTVLEAVVKLADELEKQPEEVDDDE